jgi:splicing factor 3A subunit 3
MDSVFELQRQTHEELELFQRALYDLLSRPPASHDRRLQNEHRASQVLDRITNRTAALDSLYADEDARKADIALLSAAQRPEDLSEFYSRLVKIQEHHNKYPDSAPGIDLELASFLDEAGQEDDDFEEEDRASVSPAIAHSPPLTLDTRSNLALVLW